MKYIYKASLFIFLFFAADNSHAQQSQTMSHYMFNGLLLNPGYAGSKDYVSTTLLYRRQWVGLDGAPTTQSFSIHGPIKNKKLGLGFYVMNDKIGVTGQTDLYGSIAYHVPLSNAKLSFGLQIGLSSYKSDIVNLKVWDPVDKIFNYNTYSNTLPNAGFGVFYYQPLFYMGFSTPGLISYNPQERFSIKSDTVLFKYNRRYYFTSGYVIETEGDIKLKPSLLLKYENNAPLQFDLNLNMLINDIFWIGASYRSNDAVVAIFEYQVNRKFRIGYSYDYTLSKLRTYQSGSHELMLGYDFGYDVLKMKTPRYF